MNFQNYSKKLFKELLLIQELHRLQILPIFGAFRIFLNYIKKLVQKLFQVLNIFLFIQIDDQICLLINSWCELLLFSCCYRSISTPGEIKVSQGKSITLEQARSNGLNVCDFCLHFFTNKINLCFIQLCIERMLHLTDHLRRLKVDKYEYVAMKVIVLLSSGNLNDQQLKLLLLK